MEVERHMEVESGPYSPLRQNTFLQNEEDVLCVIFLVFFFHVYLQTICE